MLRSEVLTGLSAHEVARSGQFNAEAAYGFPVLRGRFTGSPWVGVGVLQGGRDYRVGYRMSPARQSRTAIHVGIEGVRRENDGSGDGAEHAVALHVGKHW